MTYPRMAHGSVVVNGSLWVLGGFAPTQQTPYAVLNSVEVYNRDAGYYNVTAVPPLPAFNSETTGMGAVVALSSPADGRVYLLGGGAGGNDGLDFGCLPIVTATSATNAWAKEWVSAPAYAQEGELDCYFSAAYHGGVIFLIATVTGQPGSTSVLSFSVTDWGAGWHTLPQGLNVPRKQAVALVQSGLLWVIGGLQPSTGAVAQYLNITTATPPANANATGSWQFGPHLPEPLGQIVGMV